MASLFKRDWKLIVDTLDVSALDFSFACEKDTKPEPNKVAIKLYNLSPDHIAEITKRAKAAKSTGVRIEVLAGYVDNTFMVFSGDAREISTVQDGANRLTTISAHDGGRAYRESRISRSYAPGTSVSSVIAACAEAMSIGIGNSMEASGGVGGSFPNGITLHGKVSDQLQRVCKAAGLTWSVQYGVLQLQRGGAPLQTVAVRIAPDTGMVGSPTMEMDSSIPTKKGAIKTPTLVGVRTLMMSGLSPGRKVVLDTAEYHGGYQITECKYVGDTAGNDWNIDLKLRPY